MDISRIVSGESTAGSGSATNAAQRHRSVAVLQSSAAGATARPSMTGSRRATSLYGWTRYPTAVGSFGAHVVLVIPTGPRTCSSRYCSAGAPVTRATTSPRSAYARFE
ncbi:MAG TPA: hypothetical protein VFM13_14905 [Gaiellaceae bacterium]|nr:hypothetical protein [Gaiellaceae bacterium]